MKSTHNISDKFDCTHNSVSNVEVKNSLDDNFGVEKTAFSSNDEKNKTSSLNGAEKSSQIQNNMNKSLTSNNNAEKISECIDGGGLKSSRSQYLMGTMITNQNNVDQSSTRQNLMKNTSAVMKMKNNENDKANIPFGDNKESSNHVEKLSTNENDVKNLSTNEDSVEKLPPRENDIEKASTRQKLERITSQEPVNYCQLVTSWRFAMVLLLMFSMVVGNLPRMSMGMSLVCMVDTNTSRTETANTATSQATQTANISDSQATQTVTISLQEGRQFEFSWSSETLGLILAAMSFTQFLSPILGDLVRRYLGNRTTLALFYGGSAGLLLVTPTAARWSPYALMVMCMLQGCLIMANVVVVGDTLAWWSPVNEKLVLTALVHTGMSAAGLLGNTLAGFLCSIPLDNGWPLIFYTFGGVTTIFVILWLTLSSRSPEDHPFVSDKEKNYIIARRSGMASASAKTVDRPPYKKILMSVPFWAYLVPGWCFFWSMTTMFSYMPIFFSKVQGFTPEEVGVLISMFSIVSIFGNPFWAWVGNQIHKRLDTNKTRKICVGVGYSLACGLIMSMAFLLPTADRWVIYALLLSAIFMLNVGSSTVTVVALDMAPKYAGFLNSVWFSSSTLATSTGPITMSFLTANNTIEEWRNAWVLCGSIMMLGALIFLFFGQASIQDWAVDQSEKKDENIT